ncbi:MAG: hypothetical protein K8S13_00570 [Desulfobacula sp.]|uniref:hypothetical protein n=1 Tax=Desulfobacula sp. TaxID=2593537 RepID=UPI0025BD8414|nr:hypothetical protein [Desulfobacula sp.]MCD4718341.1 hypothetical protein [Desulfobacula sp.]
MQVYDSFVISNPFDIEVAPNQLSINRNLEDIDLKMKLYLFVGGGMSVLAGLCILLQFIGLRSIPVILDGPPIAFGITLLIFAIPILYCWFDQMRFRHCFESIDDQGKFELKILMDNSRIVTKYVNYVMNQDEDEDRKIAWSELEMLRTAAYRESLHPEESRELRIGSGRSPYF